MQRRSSRYYNHTVNVSVHGSLMATRHNYLSRDPMYRDAYGQPMLRITFDFPDNDVRMANYVTDRAVEIAKLMGGETVVPLHPILDRALPDNPQR